MGITSLIENWHLLRILIVSGMLVALVAVALIAGGIRGLVRRPPRKALPRIDSPRAWHARRAGNDRLAA